MDDLNALGAVSESSEWVMERSERDAEMLRLARERERILREVWAVLRPEYGRTR